MVSAYYQRLAEHTRGHGITAGDAVEEVIPADRGLPGHGGPLPLPDSAGNFPSASGWVRGCD